MDDAETAGARAKAPEPRPWEASVGRGGDCLKANARRYRVVARNAPRAALQTLQRHRIGIARAQNAELHIALYEQNDSSGVPKAVFRVGGTPQAPELQLCYARLRDSEAQLYRPGGPLDKDAVIADMPGAARRRAEAQLGTGGLRDVLDETFWQREISLYTGTAVFLAALGFPMSPGVFVVGAVLLLMQGAIRLAKNEFRLYLAKRRMVYDETLQPALHAAAVRRLFARDVGLDVRDLEARLGQTVLRGEITVPDLSGDNSLKIYVDEDARVAAGALRPLHLGGAKANKGEAPVVEELDASENILTVVFRRPKRVRMAKPDDEVQSDDGAARPQKLDIDDIGQKSKVPAKVDLDELGRGDRQDNVAASERPNTRRDDEDVEVVDAEVISPEEFFSPGGGRRA